MKKLQLYITMSKGDFRQLVDINADPQVKAMVGDLRSAVCQVDYQASAMNIFYLMKYTEAGVFIVVLRTIPDVVGNYLAAWIYAPYSCLIPDKDLYSVVDFVSKKVAGHSLSSQVISEIRQVFNHEYEENPLAPIFAPTLGKNFAYRYYNGNTDTTLADLIGRFRYQVCYLPFAGVLMVDASISDNVSGTNLTSAPKETMAALLPPDLANADGYIPTIYGCRFDVPFFAPMDKSFDIIWMKKGAENVKQPVTVTKSEMQAPAFVEYTRPVKKAPKTETVSPRTEAIASKPRPEKKEEIHTEPIMPTDAEPYEDDKEYDEEATPNYSEIITKALYAAGGFLLGVIVTLLFTCSRDDEPIETPHPQQSAEQEQVQEPAAETTPGDVTEVVSAVSAETQTVQPETETPAVQEAAPSASTQEPAKPTNDLNAAIAYLDKNSTWSKTEMSKYPDLNGLFDDMNKVDRKSIINKWGPKLKKSKKFQNIVKHARLSTKKKARRTPYTKGNSIPLQDFLNNMDP